MPFLAYNNLQRKKTILHKGSNEDVHIQVCGISLAATNTRKLIQLYEILYVSDEGITG